jgi:hypothetical protein
MMVYGAAFEPLFFLLVAAAKGFACRVFLPSALRLVSAHQSLPGGAGLPSSAAMIVDWQILPPHPRQPAAAAAWNARPQRCVAGEGSAREETLWERVDAELNGCCRANGRASEAVAFGVSKTDAQLGERVGKSVQPGPRTHFMGDSNEIGYIHKAYFL